LKKGRKRRLPRVRTETIGKVRQEKKGRLEEVYREKKKTG